MEAQGEPQGIDVKKRRVRRTNVPKKTAIYNLLFVLKHTQDARP